MAKINKPRPQSKPKKLTIQQWAPAKYKQRLPLKYTNGETLTEIVGRLCIELKEENPDNIAYDGEAYTTGSTKPFFSTMKITESVRKDYNAYLVKFEEDLELYNKSQADYRSRLEEWKQQMINKLKAM